MPTLLIELNDGLLVEVQSDPRTSSRVHPTASAISCCVWQASHILKIRLLRASLASLSIRDSLDGEPKFWLTHRLRTICVTHAYPRCLFT